MNKKEPLGIIAGTGDLPLSIIKNCAEKHILYVASLCRQADTLENCSAANFELGQIGTLLSFFKSNGVSHITFAGKIPRPNIMDLKVDDKGKEWLKKIGLSAFRGDDALLKKIITLVENEGFKVIDSSMLMPINNLKIVTKKQPSKEQTHSIEKGFNLIADLSSYDVGQAVVIEHDLVLGIEAVEGTDELIKRCASLRKDTSASAILIKCAKSNQTLQIDRPTIGLNTLLNIKNAGFAGLAYAPEDCHVLDADKLTDYANDHELFIFPLSRKTS